jgi:hypothetical protein
VISIGPVPLLALHICLDALAGDVCAEATPVTPDVAEGLAPDLEGEEEERGVRWVGEGYQGMWLRAVRRIWKEKQQSTERQRLHVWG